MLIVQLARAAVLAAAGAVVTLAQLELPSRSFWAQRTALQWMSVAVVAVAVCYDAVRSVNSAVQARRISRFDNDLRVVLSGTAFRVVEATGAPFNNVAVRYYRLRRRVRGRRLSLIGAFMAGSEVADLSTDVRIGVGVVGTSFSTEMILTMEWREFVREATRRGPAAWNQRSAAERLGLSWGQLRRSAQPEGVPEGVVASPTFDAAGRPDGCILVSGMLKPADLESEEISRILDWAATGLARVGAPPAGWWGSHGR
ncbi:hypothetical protein [Actinoplanes sp. NPDC049118]|uniref:hypothetical protein n=1 Tax=Actinoplanes sp. NPDC049118 TaxID=3155769 RepID=UPI0033C313B4